MRYVILRPKQKKGKEKLYKSLTNSLSIEINVFKYKLTLNVTSINAVQFLWQYGYWPLELLFGTTMSLLPMFKIKGEFSAI